MHRSNFIEKLGTGLLRIDSELEQAGQPKAELEISEHWFSIIFKRKPKIADIDESWSNFDGSISLNEQGEKILFYCSNKPKSRAEIFKFLELSNETRNFTRHILPLLDNKLIQMTIPNKPRSMNQKYIITGLGKKLLNGH